MHNLNGVTSSVSRYELMLAVIRVNEDRKSRGSRVDQIEKE